MLLEPVAQIGQQRIAHHAHRVRGVVAQVGLEQPQEPEGAAVEPVLVQVRGAQRGDEVQAAACPGERDRDHALAVRVGEGAEVVHHAAVRGAAVAGGEDHGVTHHGGGAHDRHDHERLGVGGVLAAAAGEELVGPRRLRGRGLHGGGHPAGVLLGHRDHGQGLLGPVADVLEHALHGAGDLGVRGLDHVAAGHRDAGALGQVLGRDGTIPAGGLARGGQRVQGAVIGERGEQAHEAPLEGAVHGAQRQGGQHLVQRVVGRAQRAQGPGGRRRVHGHLERLRAPDHRVAEGHHLGGAGERAHRGGQGGRVGLQQHDDVGAPLRGELGQGHGRGGDHRHERLQELGGDRGQGLDRGAALLEQGAQHGRVRAIGAQRLPPARGQRGGEPGAAALEMGAVQVAEPALDLRQVRAAHHGQEVVPGDHRLERGLPPRQLELGGQGLGGHLAVAQVLEQLRQAVVAQAVQHEGALGQRGQGVAVRHEPVDGGHEVVHVALVQRPLGHGLRGEDALEPAQVLAHLADVAHHVLALVRHLRGRARLGGVAVPVLQDGGGVHEGAVQVRGLHARADRVLRRAAQAGPGHRGHLDQVEAPPRAGGGRRDQLGHVEGEHLGGELGEGAGHTAVEVRLLRPAGHRALGAQAGLGGGGVHGAPGGVQGGRQLVGQLRGGLGLLHVAHAGAEPAALGGGGGERAELPGAHELLAHGLPVHGGVQHGALEAHGGGRRRLEPGQGGQGLHRLERRAAPAGADVVQRADVLLQPAPPFGQRGLVPGGVGVHGPLGAQDGLHELAAEQLGVRVGGHIQRDRAQVRLLEAVEHVGQGGGALGHDQHAPALPGQACGQGGGGLGLPGAGGGRHHEGLPRRGVLEHARLGGVDVQDEALVGRGDVVLRGRARGLQRRRARHHAGAGVVQGLHDRQILEGGGQGGGLAEVRERGDEQAILDVQVRDRGGLLAQAGERGGGLEARRGVGGLLVRLGVQGDAVVPAQVPHERRVQAGRLGDLDLQLVPAPGAAAHRQGHAGQQHGGGAALPPAVLLGRPRGHAHGERADVDAAFLRQLADLGAQAEGDLVRRVQLRAGRQQGGQAGAPPQQQLRDAGGVRLREVDAVGRRGREPQHRVVLGARAQGGHPGGRVGAGLPLVGACGGAGAGQARELLLGHVRAVLPPSPGSRRSSCGRPPRSGAAGCGAGRAAHSHSMVPGGLLVTSSTTRLTPSTSLVMRFEMRDRTSSGIRAQSAVMASSLMTGRRTTGWP